MALIRLVVFGLIAETIVYVALSIYSRSLRREKLEKRWAEDHPGDQDSPARDAYIAEGMEHYRQGLRRKLILLVYIVPTVFVIVMLFIVNTN